MHNIVHLEAECRKYALMVERSNEVLCAFKAEAKALWREFQCYVGELSAERMPPFAEVEQLSRDDLELEIPKNQLAGMLGTIPETLSRILGKMTKHGLIETKGSHIRISDREGLRELADGLKRLT